MVHAEPAIKNRWFRVVVSFRLKHPSLCGEFAPGRCSSAPGTNLIVLAAPQSSTVPFVPVRSGLESADRPHRPMDLVADFRTPVEAYA